jgi:hypothetical protein
VRWFIVGESPVIQSDNPARDIVGGRRVDFVMILSRPVLIGACDVDECQHSAHRGRRIGIGAEDRQAAGCNLTACSKPSIQSSHRMSPLRVSTANSGL